MSGEAAPRHWLRALGANLSWLLASNGLMAALSLIYIGILTRTLGISDFGRFALITGAAQMLAVLVSFETWKPVVQYGLEHEAAGNEGALARLLKACMLTEVGSAALGIAGVVILFTIWPEPFGLAADVKPYALGYAIVQLVTLRSTPTGMLRLKDKYGLGAMADSVQPLGRLIGAFAALALWPTIAGFLVAYAFAEIVTALVCWWLALRSVGPGLLRRARFGWHATMAENGGLLRAMLSTNVQTSLGLASRQLPLLFVGGYDGPAAAGAFRLALQLANALSKVSTLVMRAAFPEIVRSISNVTREQFLRLIVRIFAGGLAGAAVVFLIVLLFGRWLLVLVGGHDFGGGYLFLLWLASAGCVEIAAAAFEPILFSLRRAGMVIVARLAAVLIQLGAMAVLLPAYGAWGASVSIFLGAVLSAAFLGVGLARHAREHGKAA